MNVSNATKSFRRFQVGISRCMHQAAAALHERCVAHSFSFEAFRNDDFVLSYIIEGVEVPFWCRVFEREYVYGPCAGWGKPIAYVRLQPKHCLIQL
jgi:hypothetical protein